MKRTSNDLFENYKQKHKHMYLYYLWGFGTTGVSLVAYTIFIFLFQRLSFTDAHAIFYSTIISWFFAVTYSFITSKIFVFESKSWAPKLVISEAAIFYGTRIITGIIEALGVPFLYGLGYNYALFGVTGLLSKITVAAAITLLNYFFTKQIFFGKEEQKENPKEQPKENLGKKRRN